VGRIAQGIRALSRPPVFHTDAVQAFMKLETPPALLGADLATISGHKIGAPKGVGALWVKKGTRLSPLLTGGGQEGDFRSGTEPMPAIAAFAAACARRGETLLRDLAHEAELNRLLRRELAEKLPFAQIISDEESSVPAVCCLALPGARSEVIVRILSDRGVAVSGGSACAKGKKSRVLSAMKLPPRWIDGAVRVSFCPENTEEDVAALRDGLMAAAARFALMK